MKKIGSIQYIMLAIKKILDTLCIEMYANVQIEGGVT